MRLLTRTGLNWTAKYPAIAAEVATLAAGTAYLDGELCGVGPDGVTSFGMIHSASDWGYTASLLLSSCRGCIGYGQSWSPRSRF